MLNTLPNESMLLARQIHYFAHSFSTRKRYMNTRDVNCGWINISSLKHHCVTKQMLPVWLDKNAWTRGSIQLEGPVQEQRNRKKGVFAPPLLAVQDLDISNLSRCVPAWQQRIQQTSTNCCSAYKFYDIP